VDLFKKQLRAILRASAFGNVKIMLPMISAIEELRKARVIIKDTMDELAASHIPFNADIEVGVMIEVPSAALTSDLLAGEADFFSIGTNDLVQYSLAVDRGNERVAGLYQPAHPAILRLLATTIKSAHSRGIPVALCGEMSADVVFTLVLLGLGLREISLSPTSIPEVKKMIRSMTMHMAKEVTGQLINFSEAKEIEAFLRDRVKKIRNEE
jgi:phosphotransferase system enzyme I (PtsI)